MALNTLLGDDLFASTIAFAFQNHRTYFSTARPRMTDLTRLSDSGCVERWLATEGASLTMTAFEDWREMDSCSPVEIAVPPGSVVLVERIDDPLVPEFWVVSVPRRDEYAEIAGEDEVDN
jgi:hypothetical protein